MTRSRECEEIGNELSALLDGELAPERVARVRAHVDGCAGCRAELASLERIDPWLARVPVPPAGDERLASLRARIAAESSQPPRRAQSPRGRTLRRSLAAVALAAAAALALYLAVGRPRAPLAPEVAPEPRIASAPEAVAPVAPASVPDPDFDAMPAEELAVGLDLDTAQDLDVIANLQLLEAYVALEERS